MTTGIHHITAISSDAQRTIHFYSKFLGLRLVKKTVNQDDVSTYHLFFGDRLGHPGMDLTFFIFQPPSAGLRGNGLVTTISFAVAENTLSFWLERFRKLNIKNMGITERFGFKRIVFFDYDNQQLELVEITEEVNETNQDIWTTKEISNEFAIRSFYGASLSVSHEELIDPVLSDLFGFKHIQTMGKYHLYKLPTFERAGYIEVLVDPSLNFGISGAGAVHHIAFRVPNEKKQLELQMQIAEMGLYPTEVIDRFYFKSVYFRTPVGILFEIATDGPGFTADEKDEVLGSHLALPPFLESQRKIIESQLPEIVSE